MVSGSQEIMKFENVLFGNEYGSWTGSSFVAPVDGVYKFSLHLLTYYSSRAYRLRALINDGDDGVDHLLENSARYRSYSYDGHGHNFQIERELKVGDTLTIKDEYAYDTLRDYNYFKCKTNEEEHSCSYFTGRLIKKL